MLRSKQIADGRETKPNRSATAHQLELKAKHELTDRMFEQMLEMLAELTPAERATLKDRISSPKMKPI
jgi:hypothetical protein